MIEKTQDQEIKDKLRKNTESAIAKGVFGVPTCMVDGERFWGNDRLDFLKKYLEGKVSYDKSQAEKILARPRTAERSC